MWRRTGRKSLGDHTDDGQSGEDGLPRQRHEQYPRGDVDPTDHYFLWSANLDSDTDCEVFMVEVPASQL